MTNALLIFAREVRDQFRDRRTMFMVLGLPLVLYPAIGAGMLQMTSMFQEQPRTIVVTNADELADPPLIVDGRFNTEYLDAGDDASKLIVVTDESAEPQASDDETPGGAEEKSPGEAEPGLNALRLQAAEKIDALLTERAVLEFDAEQFKDDAEESARIKEINGQIADMLADGDMQVLILVPEGFAESVREYNRALVAGTVEEGTPRPGPKVVVNEADDKSGAAASKVRRALKNWEKEILARRLDEAGLPADLADPVETQEIDVATKEAVSANIFSRIIVYMLLITTVTGAYYPAVDLCAGEKERGTMETILICPADRLQIVLGKFLTVLLFSGLTAILSLVSIGGTAYFAANVASSAGGDGPPLEIPPLGTLVWVGVLLVPLAAFFSAVAIGLAMYARSTKEGQYYLTPMIIVTMGITLFAIAPGVEMTPLFSVLPVVGPALLLRQVVADPSNVETLLYFIPVLSATAGYCGLALWWAVEQFKSEEVIFRGAEQFDFGLWLKSLVRDRQATPSFAEAAVCFGLLMALQYASLLVFAKWLPEDPADAGPRLLQMLAIQQTCLIALPALLMGFAFARDLRQTFRIRWPRAKYLATALVLPFFLHPPFSEFVGWSAENIFPESAESFAKALQAFTGDDLPWWAVVLTMAFVPAVCEEIAFRGFILSGFTSRGRIGVGIVFSAICFGVLHMIPLQVFYASILGLLLGLIAIRSGSLLPCILFHFINNSVSVLLGRVPEGYTDPTGGALFEYAAGPGGESVPQYGWLTITVGAVVSAAWIAWLIRTKDDAPADRRFDDPQAGRLEPTREAAAEPAGV